MTLKTRNIEKSLIKKGFRLRNSDHKYFIYEGSKKKGIVTKISHSHNEIGDDLISKMSKQLNMSKDFFVSYIECTKNEADYVKILNIK